MGFTSTFETCCWYNSVMIEFQKKKRGNGAMGAMLLKIVIFSLNASVIPIPVYILTIDH